MNTIDELASIMKRLHEPTPPASLSATVMARIEREADRRSAAASTEMASQRTGREQLAWLWALAGLVVVLCASAYGWIETGSLPDVTSPKIGHSLTLIPMEGPTALIIGAGLLVYLAGLVAPLRTGRRT